MQSAKMSTGSKRCAMVAAPWTQTRYDCFRGMDEIQLRNMAIFDEARKLCRKTQLGYKTRMT